MSPPGRVVAFAALTFGSGLGRKSLEVDVASAEAGERGIRGVIVLFEYNVPRDLPSTNTVNRADVEVLTEWDLAFQASGWERRKGGKR